MATVTLWGALSAATDGKNELEIEALNIRELFQKLEDQYPATRSLINRGIAVSINGVIYRDDWSKPIPENAAVFLLPRLAGG